MPSAVTTSNLSPNYLAAEYLTRQVFAEAAQIANIWGNVTYQDLTDLQTMTAHFRYLNPLVGVDSGATEASVLTQFSWSPTGVVITAGLTGFYILESKLTDSIAPSALTEIAQQAGSRLARDLDTSLALQFPNLTAGTVGTSGVAASVNNYIDADANLDATFTIGKRKGFVHPKVFAQLKKDISSKNYGIAKITVDAFGVDTIEIGAITLYKNALVPKINSNADFAGGVFVEQAIGLVMPQSPRIQILDVPTQAAYSIEGSIAYGAALIRPLFGVLTQHGVTA